MALYVRTRPNCVNLNAYSRWYLFKFLFLAYLLLDVYPGYWVWRLQIAGIVQRSETTRELIKRLAGELYSQLLLGRFHLDLVYRRGCNCCKVEIHQVSLPTYSLRL
jgi:hypothetical protein